MNSYWAFYKDKILGFFFDSFFSFYTGEKTWTKNKYSTDPSGTPNFEPIVVLWAKYCKSLRIFVYRFCLNGKPDLVSIPGYIGVNRCISLALCDHKHEIFSNRRKCQTCWVFFSVLDGTAHTDLHEKVQPSLFWPLKVESKLKKIFILFL